MQDREMTFRHLGTGDVAAVVLEIIAGSGLQQNGIGVGNLPRRSPVAPDAICNACRAVAQPDNDVSP